MFVGISANVMQRYWSAQERQDYCWAACVQMVLKRYGVERSQGEIDFKGNGPNLFNLFPDRSGYRFSIEYNFNEPFTGTFHCTSGEGAPEPRKLLDELHNHRPVIVGYDEGPQARHAVVVFAAEYTQTNTWPVLQTIHVVDPFPGRGIRPWSSGRLYPLVSEHFFIHAYN